MILARVVLPEPGGPQKMHDPTSPRRMSSPSALPGPRRLSWPRKPSRVRGRMRAASGSAEAWKRVGSVTPRPGCEMRDARCVETVPQGRKRVGPAPRTHPTFRDVRKLERFDTWRTAQEIACEAYLLTLNPQLSKHFALIDQIRRAALSVPANIAEGYSLGTTPQFLRGLKIALGSNTELYSHLTVLARLDLIPADEVCAVMELCNRVIALIIGLTRKLSQRS